MALPTVLQVQAGLGLGAGNREAMQKSGMREKTDRKDLGEPSQGQPTG